MKIRISNGFLKGYLRALNLTGNDKEWPDLSDERIRDYEALRSDWDSVGETIRRETRGFKQAGC